MRVFARVCVCVLGLVAASPLAADATPIVLGGQGCESLPDNCAVVDIADPTSATLTGEFTFDNDVALFQFVLGPGEYNFSAATDSYDPGFDPFLALYSRTPGATGGSQVVVNDTFARNDNVVDVIDPTAVPLELDAALAFQLIVTQPTEYILALIQAGNEAIEDQLAFTWDDAAFRCATSLAEECAAGEFIDFYTLAALTGSFSLTINVSPVDSNPVPERGTLSLLALGAAAALARRRRARLEPR